MADIPREDWIPEVPFDSSDWAEVPDDFVPMTPEEMADALARAGGEAAGDAPDD